MIRHAAELLRATYLRYVAASAIALGVDVGIFLALTRLGTAAVLASALGYIAGLMVHWFISTRAVFADDLADEGAARHRQQIMFLGSALIGLALTVGIVGLADRLGIDTRLAKLGAIVVSFQATYLLRRRIVFI